MHKPPIACCYFPTTVVFIDDHESFLKSLELTLEQDIVPKMFSNPIEALNFLKEEYRPTPFIEKWLTNISGDEYLEGIDEGDETHAYIDVDISMIHREIYSQNRFREISTVVVDYAMPPMDGLGVCRAIKDKPFRRVMLTGQADNSLAVNAFNEGLIHHFVQKGALNFHEELSGGINLQQKIYFQKLSEIIIKSLATQADNPLGDPVFLTLFYDMIKKYQIIEYYLISPSGSFLMLDIKGNPYWFVIQNEAAQEYHYNVAHDNEAPKEIVDALRNREMMVFLFSQDDLYNVAVNEWEDYMHPAKRLEGEKEIYHYTFFEDNGMYAIDRSKICSYYDFLMSL